MIYAIDVDGVIINSRNQILIDAYNNYRGFFKTSIFDNVKIKVKNYKEIFEKHKKTVNKFLELSNFSNCAEETTFLYYLIDNNIKVENDKDFRTELSKISKETLKKWHDSFYVQRYEFMEDKNWDEILIIYDKMVEFIKENIEKVIILSNKDLVSIKHMNKKLGINLDDKKLLTRDLSTDKNLKLKIITEEFKIPYNEIYFIEDNFFNVQEANKLGVKCFLATWGFNSDFQKKEAEKLGIELLELGNWSSLF